MSTWELIAVGGWPMVLLGLCSVAGLAIVIERSLGLRRGAVLSGAVVALTDNYPGEAQAQQALGTCQRAKGAYARIIEELLRKRQLDHAQAIETMRAVGRTQVGQLERGLAVLEIIAGISPLIGLLGTVLGMVTVFNAITAQGLGNPQVLSEGISEALITTVGGLAVAIPAFASHAILSRRVESLAVEMQDRATSFLVLLQSGRE
ncbi:MAG: MotA/TolQ/ExbB proton channel family protein [Candidatus Hydrogenedens sp.]|nr:MotA/TolQ/ExbB proton channel family protein [Candidatus Hydrogenedens sp.]